ncbi:mannonate dehydratase [Endozoicomonas elysicola]|uniref:Mannonate dehydratase n=1 Tax=Endozoicomonas elysicola TaxID=305900 RepID=A0A081KGY2_9GAMM|nr:mannonate dehydratase [Endozoicomonas elysicola]KEI73408.1 mannonate dehydratase [Endozoicomonas elysicola]
MKMTFRWYGTGNDSVALSDIRQIPGCDGIVWALHDMPAGEVWPLDRIMAVKEEIEAKGFNIDVVESVNVHEDIKLGLPSREQYITNYKETIVNLAKAGVKVICYNFMPVFDWTRTDLFKELPDGSTALFYESSKVVDVDPVALIKKVSKGSEGYTMPGWEPERLARIEELFEAYKDVTEEQLWENLKYFLEEIVPFAQQHDIKMAIHPDDPPWPIFGLPRIITGKKNLQRFLNLVDNPSNCLTLCTGSLGANPENDLPDIVRSFADRIAFMHIRNVKIFENGDFIETSHRTCDGNIDIYDVVKALHENDYKGYVRPDHGRHIWNESCRPGYGLYDRALGIMYIWGVWDSLQRLK